LCAYERERERARVRERESTRSACVHTLVTVLSYGMQQPVLRRVSRVIISRPASLHTARRPAMAARAFSLRDTFASQSSGSVSREIDVAKTSVLFSTISAKAFRRKAMRSGSRLVGAAALAFETVPFADADSDVEKSSKLRSSGSCRPCPAAGSPAGAVPSRLLPPLKRRDVVRRGTPPTPALLRAASLPVMNRSMRTAGVFALISGACYEQGTRSCVLKERMASQTVVSA
jgi:hypothetical protein